MNRKTKYHENKEIVPLHLLINRLKLTTKMLVSLL